jgi:molecular chaperone GrpE
MADHDPRPDVDADLVEPDDLRDLREKAARADEYLELARRTKADFINYQDRIRREREDWGRDAVMQFVRDFLPALDSFTWARFEEPTLMESLHLVERELLRTLAHHHIVPIATAGRMFDPAFHEVVAVEETSDKPAGTILDQVRRGWMIGNKVIRPAGVRVAKAPEEQRA